MNDNKHRESRLEISQSGLSDNGYYQCVAQNMFGSSQDIGRLLIESTGKITSFKLCQIIYRLQVNVVVE